jgi:L-threonylcarbamoyladenylate synthase
VSRLTPSDRAAFERCLAGDGVAVFPADTVYGLAWNPASQRASERVYALKGRPTGKPAAVMFFSVERLLAGVPELGARTRAAIDRLLPGPVTVVVANPERRFALAGGDGSTLGLRVPALPDSAAALAETALPALQTSANVAGAPDARRVADIPAEIRAEADVVLDAGELPGTPSTVVDLRDHDATGDWAILREGAVPEAEIARLLGRHRDGV